MNLEKERFVVIEGKTSLPILRLRSRRYTTFKRYPVKKRGIHVPIEMGT